MCNLSMQQCNLYCYCNVSANRMQSDESLLSKAMLRCSLTSLLQCQCKPNAERWELALKSYAEVQPDFATAMSVQTECRTWKLVFKSYAEVQPDFAIAMSVQTECRVMRACSQKLCWGAAWLRYCNVSANRMQSDESLLSKAMLRCSLTSLLQRYNAHTPKSKFFRRLISHHESFPHPKIGIEPFIYGHFRAFSTREKKWNRDITFYLMLIIKTYEAAMLCLT